MAGDGTRVHQVSAEPWRQVLRPGVRAVVSQRLAPYDETPDELSPLEEFEEFKRAMVYLGRGYGKTFARIASTAKKWFPPAGEIIRNSRGEIVGISQGDGSIVAKGKVTLHGTHDSGTVFDLTLPNGFSLDPVLPSARDKALGRKLPVQEEPFYVKADKKKRR